VWSKNISYVQQNIFLLNTSIKNNIILDEKEFDEKKFEKITSLLDLNLFFSNLTNGINSAVGQDDILFHLGDWSFGGFEMIEQFRNRINCKNVHIILGNHDHHIERDREDIRRLFTSVNQYLELEVKSFGSLTLKLRIKKKELNLILVFIFKMNFRLEINKILILILILFQIWY
jgi:hypothetical protein